MAKHSGGSCRLANSAHTRRQRLLIGFFRRLFSPFNCRRRRNPHQLPVQRQSMLRYDIGLGITRFQPPTLEVCIQIEPVSMTESVRPRAGENDANAYSRAARKAQEDERFQIYPDLAVAARGIRFPKRARHITEGRVEADGESGHRSSNSKLTLRQQCVDGSARTR